MRQQKLIRRRRIYRKGKAMAVEYEKVFRIIGLNGYLMSVATRTAVTRIEASVTGQTMLRLQ